MEIVRLNFSAILFYSHVILKYTEHFVIIGLFDENIFFVFMYLWIFPMFAVYVRQFTMNVQYLSFAFEYKIAWKILRHSYQRGSSSYLFETLHIEFIQYVFENYSFLYFVLSSLLLRLLELFLFWNVVVFIFLFGFYKVLSWIYDFFTFFSISGERSVFLSP